MTAYILKIMDKKKIIVAVVSLLVVVLAVIFSIRNGNVGSSLEFERKLNFPSDMPEGVRSDLESKIKASVETLKQDQESFNDWYDLGLYYKTLDDYEGARIVWEHAAELRPENYLPRLALADLYGFFLHDSAKADYYYQEAIAKEPTQAFSYFQAAIFWRDVENDSAHALEVVKQGLVANPDDKDLQGLKKELEKTNE